jgi:tricorn protease
MASGYYRFPTISSNMVVFVCEDDLWSVPAEGGIARRLTANLGEVSRPCLSLDGSQLAFVGREEGQSEIYVMPALGGAAQRLTYMGGSLCLTAGWTDTGKIIFANNSEHWHFRFTYLYTVDSAGSSPEKLNYGLARAISFGPSGGVVLGRNTDDPARWKRYRGGTAGNLWIKADGTGDFKPFIKLPGNLASPMWIGERVYFISDHEGVGNLYSCSISGEDIQRHTHHEDYYVRNASSDGDRIVYHAGGDLFVYDPMREEDQQIEVQFHSPQIQRNRRFIDPAQYLDDWAIHPKGHSTVITTRSKLFSFSNWEGAVIQHGSEQSDKNGVEVSAAVRYRLPQYLNDGKRLIAVCDEGGEESFVVLNADGSGDPHFFSNLDIGLPDAVAVNPKNDQVAFSNHRYELICLDLVSGDLRMIDRGKAAPIAGFSWSPDGEWLAYSVSTSLQVMVLKLWKAASGEIFPLTKPVLRDVAPSFDPQGKYLYFLSYRVFDPVYDRLQFELGFPRGIKPYLITLQKELTSPFVPKVKDDEEEKQEENDNGKQGKTNGPGDADNGSGESPDLKADSGNQEESKEGDKTENHTLTIDVEDIEDRIIAFPVKEEIYGRVLGTANGNVLYTRFPVEGALSSPIFDPTPQTKGTLLTYKFEDQKEETLISGITDFTVSAGGKTIMYRAGNRLRVFKADGKPEDDGSSPNRKTGWLELNRVKPPVIPGLEWKQMFREAWRLQRDLFWTPDMSQVDWLLVHDRYLPLVDRVSSRSEFSDLMWEMQGELGTSHAYEYGGDYRPGPVYMHGYLGADFSYDSPSNGWKVTRIHRGDSWNNGAHSPLAMPGINIKVGDVLLGVNGRRLSSVLSPEAALVNLAGCEVILSVSSEGDGASRSVTVKTLHSEVNVRYRQWVDNNRQRVHEETGGRVGYVHIPDMGGLGFAEFHRGYLAEVDRDGLIVDVRFNRGGHVSSLLLEKLARRRLGYVRSRWGEFPTPYPLESVKGPMVALINEYAGSDGDIFSHGFKVLNLGPLIGKRTWGGVVGINPRRFLVDGSLTTQPEFSYWFWELGWGVENYGVDPDIEVDITPQNYQRGEDPQMARALQEIIHLLETNPPKQPDFAHGPNLALPKLPK